MYRPFIACLCSFAFSLTFTGQLLAQEKPDFLRQMQLEAVENKAADWVHWGDNPSQFSSWTNHSNRLIPVYTYGLSLDSVIGEHSVYRCEEKLKAIYGKVPEMTLNSNAEYFDQTDIYYLQKNLMEFGGSKKNIILIIFDGMDWQTSQAAAIYRHKRVVYTKGRGTGLSFLDYGVDNGVSDYGFIVTSAHNNGTKTDVNAQVVTNQRSGKTGGYSWEFGGSYPWSKAPSVSYLLGKKNDLPHIFADSASSASSMTSGIKTYNSSINLDADGNQVETIARRMQENGFSVGIVTNVPIPHATPACAYANNVSRNDYQDITRDMVGLPSISHRDNPLPGMDVLIGCGWGETRSDARATQGVNYVPGNKFIAAADMKKIDVETGGKYVVAQRTAGKEGSRVLDAGVENAISGQHRLFGFFGAKGGHLPYQTADGNYDPTRGVSKADKYKPEEIRENPTLAEMTSAALKVLATNERGFWLMIEAGDVDWANHNNNIDDSIGAVFSGEAAFDAVTKWVEKNSNWEETAVILTADHGHMLILDDPEALTGPVSNEQCPISKVQ